VRELDRQQFDGELAGVPRSQAERWLEIAICFAPKKSRIFVSVSIKS
jgi:hypothetical protein